MEDESGLTGNNLQGSNNHGVTIVIGDKFGKWFLATIVVLIILMAAIGAAAYQADRRADRAEIKADQSIKTADSSANEFRMTQFWLQRVAASDCHKDLPMIPASLLK